MIMEGNMIRILQCVNDMHRAGLETMLMNYYRNVDRSKIQFDFLTHRPNRSDYDEEIESLGGKVYYAPRLYPQNYPEYFRWMKQFFIEHPEYKIMHSHIDSMSYLPLLAGKIAGVPIRIAHSHNTSIDKDFKYVLKQVFRFNINSVANRRLACGQAAGKFLFGNCDYTVIPNAVEADRFRYDIEIRKKKREELSLGENFVIGHVGRLSYQKNHSFLIDIFNEVLKKEPNSILMLVGVGELESTIKEKVQKLGLTDKVLFLGNRSDVNELYQAMDVFVLPSFFEGIPVVGVEAQFSGLSCVFSNKTPEEVSFTTINHFLDLNEPVSNWANVILKERDRQREHAENYLSNRNYDIKSAYNILQDYYLKIEADLNS